MLIKISLIMDNKFSILFYFGNALMQQRWSWLVGAASEKQVCCTRFSLSQASCRSFARQNMCSIMPSSTWAGHNITQVHNFEFSHIGLLGVWKARMLAKQYACIDTRYWARLNARYRPCICEGILYIERSYRVMAIAKPVKPKPNHCRFLKFAQELVLNRK